MLFLNLEKYLSVIINFCVIDRIKVEIKLNERKLKYGEILEMWDLLRNSERVISCMSGL